MASIDCQVSFAADNCAHLVAKLGIVQENVNSKLQKMYAVKMHHRYVSRIARYHRIAIRIPGTDKYVDTAQHYTRCSVQCNYSTAR